MMLLAQDEFIDILLFVDRFSILTVAFASRKLRAAVDALPLNCCLLQLSCVELKKEFIYHSQNSGGRLSRFVRRLFHRFVRRRERIANYELWICPFSQQEKSVFRRSPNYAELIPTLLSAIRNAYVYWVRIDLPQIPPEFEQMVLQSNSTAGRIERLSAYIDCPRVPASVFEVGRRAGSGPIPIRFQKGPSINSDSKMNYLLPVSLSLVRPGTRSGKVV